jgi:hypothetical protein
MRRFVVLSASLFLVLTLVKASDTTKVWVRGGFGSLNFTQVSFQNWAAGGEDAFSGTALLNLFANYNSSKASWESVLDLAYGKMNTTSTGLRKSEDKIELNSKYGRQATGKLFYSSLLNFRSQFDEGYNYPNDSVMVSRFMAPGYLTIAIGMDYKPTTYLSVFFSPVTGKLTFVTDKALSDSGSYGVDKGEKFRPEFGAGFQAKFQKDVVENVNVSSTLGLFNNYTDKNKGNRKNIDVNWDVMVSMKVNKFLAASASFNLIYDHDIKLPTYETVAGEKIVVSTGPKTQIKQAFGVGLSYKF